MCSDVKDNHNKFYIMQVLSKGTAYFLWTRYGRVGYDGVGELKPQGSADRAVAAYNSTYNKKTKRTYKEVKMAIGGDPVVKV